MGEKQGLKLLLEWRIGAEDAGSAGRRWTGVPPGFYSTSHPATPITLQEHREVFVKLNSQKLPAITGLFSQS